MVWYWVAEGNYGFTFASFCFFYEGKCLFGIKLTRVCNIRSISGGLQHVSFRLVSNSVRNITHKKAVG